MSGAPPPLHQTPSLSVDSHQYLASPTSSTSSFPSTNNMNDSGAFLLAATPRTQQRVTQAVAPQDPNLIKADLAKCPAWILAKLKSERELRLKLAEQTKQQTEIMSQEVEQWRSKAQASRAELQRVEQERDKRRQELERLKDMSKKAVEQLQEKIGRLEQELAKKNEILDLLTQRFKQIQGQQQDSSPSSSSSVLTSSTSMPFMSLSATFSAVDANNASSSSPTSSTPPSSLKVFHSASALPAVSGVTKPTTSKFVTEQQRQRLAGSGNNNDTNIKQMPSSSASHRAPSPRGLHADSPPAPGRHRTATHTHPRQVNTAEREQRPKSPKRILPKALSLRGTSTVQLEQLSKMKRVKGTQIGVNDFSTYLEGIATMPPQEMKKEGMDIVYLSHIKPLFNKPALRRQLITELLLEPSLRTVRAVCDSVDVNSQKDLTKALINLFSHNGTVLTLLKGIMYEEIQNTLDLSTLFRANSIAAKMLGHYIRMVGVPYITKMLSPLLEEIYNEDKSLEIDSFRNEQLTETEVRENTEELGKICTKFLDRVDSVLEECPYQFRVICNFLHEEVKKKFPDIAWPVAVGNFFYLRFICPAIVAPETMSPELVQYTTKKNTKRTLVLVSKTLQNVANGTKFFKEPFMMGMGPWIRDNLPRCEKVFEHLAVIPENKEPAKEATTQEPVECMFIIQTYLDKYRPAFIGTLEKYTETSTMDVSLTFYDRLMGILPEHPVSEKTALSAATLERLPVLTNMILEESWCVTSAILDVATKPPEAEGPKEDWSDRVAEAIVVLYELYNRAPDLLLFQFSHDTVIHKPSTQETMALKLFRCYCRLLCDDMLKDVLQTHLTKICSNDLCLVIDDSRNGESHQQQLAQLLKEMTTDVLKGLSLAPPPLWIIVQGLEKRIKEDRAQRKVKPLFSPIQFLFNALYIPALLDPVSYGLLSSAPSERSASTIALIAKAWNFATSPDQPQTFTSSSSVSLSTINQSVAFLFQTISSFFAKWLEGQPTDTAYQSRCDLRWWDQQSSPTSLSSPRALSPLSSPHSPSSPSSLPTNIKQRVIFHLFSFLQENVSLFQYSLTKETTVKLEYKLPELFSSLVKHVVRRETTGKPLAIDMTGKVVASPVTCSAASSPASSGTLMAVTPEEESDERARKKKLKGEKKKLKKEKKEEKKRKGSKRG